MKNKLFPIFITVFGLFTAYIFYALWHSEEINPPKINHEENSSMNISLENKKIIPKSSQDLHPILNSIPKVLPKQKTFKDKSYIEDKAEEVYQTLLPSTQDEFLEEAKEAFDVLDSKIMEMEEKLQEEEQNIEESMEEAEVMQNSIDDTESQVIQNSTEEESIEEDEALQNSVENVEEQDALNNNPEEGLMEQNSSEEMY